MRFGVGQVLGGAVLMWLRQFPRLFVLVVASYVPIVAFWLLLSIDAVDDFLSEHIYYPLMKLHPALRFETLGLGWIPFSLLAGAVALFVVARLRDEPIGIWRALAGALRRAPQIIAIAFIVRLVTVGLPLAIEIARWDEGGMRMGRTTYEWAFYAGLYVAISTVVVTAGPIAATERRGVFASLARMWRLARGERFKVLAVVLVHYAVIFAISYAMFYFWILRTYDASTWKTYGYLRFGMDVGLAALHPTIAAHVYERLRAAKEGPAENQLQRVFG